MGSFTNNCAALNDVEYVYSCILGWCYTGTITKLFLTEWGRWGLCVQDEEEPIALSLFKERRGPSPRERWTREPDKDQALLALARPTAERRKAEAVSAHNNEEPSEQESSPEPEHYRHSISPVKRVPRVVPQEVKYETSPERMRKSAMQRPKSAAVKKVHYFCGPCH